MCNIFFPNIVNYNFINLIFKSYVRLNKQVNLLIFPSNFSKEFYFFQGCGIIKNKYFN